jgi:mannose-6-phosphate isomerase-like protein (cupin superfamily)
MEALYSVTPLELGEPREARRFVPNVSRIATKSRGDVHLNILAPGARAGGHYHLQVKEFFVNAGPSPLMLHLRDPETGAYETVEMAPPELTRVLAYHVRLGVAHVVENPGPFVSTLIIIVDEDHPEDVVPAEVIL